MKLLSLPFEQHYLPNKPIVLLMAVCELSDSGEIQRACITDQIEAVQTVFVQEKSLENIAATLGVALLDFSRPLSLQPVYIPKPWGQEIWFTGIEARGVSQIISDTGITPLSWVLALAHEQVLGKHVASLNLLKILDPLPDEVFGDLYFELHEKKQEIYIVTHVDKTAWPSGIGAIRYGFSTDKRKTYASDANFLSAYKQAVLDYAAVRREIDQQLDVLRKRDGIAANEPVSAAQMQQWLSSIAVALQDKELQLRKAMESFTALRSLRVGDVLAVPLRTPHALQHGVRTVEFQTPVYERKIVSFAQKVLTQAHWDTEEALQLAELDTPADSVFPVLQNSDGILLEQIVSFDDFVVQRLQLAPNANFSCSTQNCYCLMMTVVGRVTVAGVVLEVEQASLVPASAQEVLLQNPFHEAATVLLAYPK